ncbi:MAG: hypothetical protein PVF83_12440 [Anaerolineales bacterium]|jgi:hypothetical protein
MKKLVIAVALMAILFIGGAIVKDASTGQVFFTAIVWDQQILNTAGYKPRPPTYGALISANEQAPLHLTPSEVASLENGTPPPKPITTPEGREGRPASAAIAATAAAQRLPVEIVEWLITVGEIAGEQFDPFAGENKKSPRPSSVFDDVPTTRPKPRRR